MKKIKLLLLMPSISPGGAERVMVHLFNHLSKDKFDVHLAVLSVGINKVGNFKKGSPQFYDLKVSRARFAFWKIRNLIYTLNPDIVFVTLPQMYLMLSLLRRIFPARLLSGNTVFIARENTNASERKKKMSLGFNLLFPDLLAQYNYIVCQSFAMAEDLNQNFSISREKLKTINNPVDFSSINNIHSKHPKFDVLSVGSLTPLKAIHRLIEAAEHLSSEVKYGIIGSGPEEDNLKNLIEEKGLTSQFTFLGFQKNPTAFISSSKIVVMTSYYEGFSNVILEALAVGTPVVAFDVPGGNSEIIKNGFNGFLVPDGDIEALALAIKKSFKHSWDKDAIKSNCFDNYNMKKIISQYENLFEDAVLTLKN
ncbi:glycosyltransferase [Membranicola marinus]|uniref:Glycosyltransferase n=1 Tax=Membranihabitans marinus TaxID=1227546 RepID=A0A953L7H5_9BACT|nr:glycosyltransferase [Membranihabitans marinus]MBY5956610.1 glycosyltransferase [Membranihabitans marinus]